jgi:hypothetical protein
MTNGEGGNRQGSAVLLPSTAGYELQADTEDRHSSYEDRCYRLAGCPCQRGSNDQGEAVYHATERSTESHLANLAQVNATEAIGWGRGTSNGLAPLTSTPHNPPPAASRTGDCNVIRNFAAHKMEVSRLAGGASSRPPPEP